MINSKTAQIFHIPFFQFAQMKKFCPEAIPQIKSDYKTAWEQWKQTILAVSEELGMPFAKPHIESWTNGWQVRSHFFAFFKYEFQQNSAAILSVILNRRRLQVCLDWHCYRAERSQIHLSQYNQWAEGLDFMKFAEFDVWRGDESEYADFHSISKFSQTDLTFRQNEDFWCIGKNVECAELDNLDPVKFISQTIRELLPLYEKCHR